MTGELAGPKVISTEVTALAPGGGLNTARGAWGRTDRGEAPSKATFTSRTASSGAFRSSGLADAPGDSLVTWKYRLVWLLPANQTILKPSPVTHQLGVMATWAA